MFSSFVCGLKNLSRLRCSDLLRPSTSLWCCRSSSQRPFRLQGRRPHWPPHRLLRLLCSGSISRLASAAATLAAQHAVSLLAACCFCINFLRLLPAALAAQQSGGNVVVHSAEMLQAGAGRSLSTGAAI